MTPNEAKRAKHWAAAGRLSATRDPSVLDDEELEYAIAGFRLVLELVAGAGAAEKDEWPSLRPEIRPAFEDMKSMYDKLIAEKFKRRRANDG